MQTIELCIDLVLVAAVDFRQAAGLLHAAVEQMRNLDAEDDRHLAVVDHLARLGRCPYDAEPAIAGAAFLRVDVVMHCATEHIGRASWRGKGGPSVLVLVGAGIFKTATQ